ncbi:unnamed protein product, partial [Polarella glacialis]
SSASELRLKVEVAISLHRHQEDLASNERHYLVEIDGREERGLGPRPADEPPGFDHRCFAPVMANAQTLAQAIADLDEENALAAVCAILDARPELAPAVVSYAVPELTYPPSKALVERRSSGYIMSFQPEKGFGFIACPELCEVFGKDVFLSCFQIGNFTVGSQVNFAVALNKEYKPQ